MTDEQVAVFMLVEKTAVLVACLRNYEYAGYQIDLTGAQRMRREVEEWLEKVRAFVPRAE